MDGLYQMARSAQENFDSFTGGYLYIICTHKVRIKTQRMSINDDCVIPSVVIDPFISLTTPQVALFMAKSLETMTAVVNTLPTFT